jgi:uncharacterized protein
MAVLSHAERRAQRPSWRRGGGPHALAQTPAAAISASQDEGVTMPLLMCPNCNASMNEVKRADVAFDMCPTCRGVWLDRGELEKIIAAARDERDEVDRERAHYAADRPPQRPPQQHPQQSHGEYAERGEHGERGEYGQQGHRKRRGGFDLFDIFD